MTTHIILISSEGTWARGETLPETAQKLSNGQNVRTSKSAQVLIYAVTQGLDAKHPPCVDGYGALCYDPTDAVARLGKSTLGVLLRMTEFGR